MTAIHVSQQMAIAPRLASRPSQTLVAATTLLALLLITARHRFAEIDHAVDVLAAPTAWRARRLGGWR